jgi:hypothetical protein
MRTSRVSLTRTCVSTMHRLACMGSPHHAWQHAFERRADLSELAIGLRPHLVRRVKENSLFETREMIYPTKGSPP